jgi:signal transduction histidine kinase/TolB-like protein/CheY-like chemotaxis protein/Flp pilus assembly protein TadD
MLDLRGRAELWRSLRRSILTVRSVPVVASAVAFLAGGNLGSQAAASNRSERRSSGDEPRDPMYQAQKMESLGRLTSGVAHDFNNLLTVVLGNAAALRVNAEARGDVQAVRRAEMIERAAERGGRLAGQLLAYSRKQMLRPETISVYQVISATSELLAQAAGETVRIRLETEPDLWKCHVDPGQLESAILNLVLNARDAMPVGGNITIHCYNQTVRRGQIGTPTRAAGNYVRIDVRDTGCGIAPELLDKVFEPFFTTKPLGQGSGLGLSQVHGFAGQSGGWADLESSVGIGTTVSLFLPRDRRRQPDSLPETDRPTPVGQNQTVLVVEPDPDLRATTSETLTRAGYKPLSAANGSGALAHIVSDAPIHLLLTEVNLPGNVSGVELARSARQVRPDLRVLISSCLPKDAPGDKGFEFLLKPYRPSDLVSVVSAMLTSDTFSVETEALLADVRTTASLMKPPKVRVSELASSNPAPACFRNDNAIRLGVIPFRTIGSSTDMAFSLGLAEEITTAFSRFRPIVCVAPASIAALADEPDRQTDRWRQLNLDFLVDGSFRKKGNDIRVLLRLINMRGVGEMSWGRRFDSLMPNLLNLQDQIASETAAQIAPELVAWDGEEVASRRQVDPTAYDLILRAIPATYCVDEAGFREAGALLERSLALDPSSAVCHAWLAHWYFCLAGQGWATDIALAAERADSLAQQAIILDPGDARAFAVAGHVRAYLRKDADAALWLHERAIDLNPNLAIAWCYSGLAHSYLGQHSEAIRRIQHAQRLSPFDPWNFFFESALGIAFFLTGQYEAAARVGRRARDLNPGFSSTYRALLAALGHLGARQEAASVRKALMALEPGLSISSFLARSPFLRQEDRDRFAEGLRLSGIPERSRL